ncbi:MAG: o-succinylbenzoate synthase [Muribaculaceae bacterium]|nr:o-succinylbenzoate synthase [Muribaculaceae bacterium]
MFKARLVPYRLRFKEAATTSRSTMLDKETFFIELTDTSNSQRRGVGEIPIFRGLSAEDTPDFTSTLQQFCSDFSLDSVPDLSCVKFGVESAMADMAIRTNPITEPFSYQINGLIWMGNKDEMFRRICTKLDDGFKCLKLKIGGIDFENEIDLLRFIRSKFSPDTLELRLDANGSFLPSNALERLKRLSRYGIHSIEQPIKQGQTVEMARIVASSPIAIALDEELIGTWTDAGRINILDTIKPHYIILKPSLCGGFESADKWISLATERNIGWWATSALESNVGLTAIALWLRQYNVTMPQGLGTGALYTNNVASPLRLEGERLIFDPTLPLPDIPAI